MEKLIIDNYKDYILSQTNKKYDGTLLILLWTDFKKLSNFMKQNNSMRTYIYTCINNEGKRTLVKGYKYVNRLGYLITTSPIDLISENGIEI